MSIRISILYLSGREIFFYRLGTFILSVKRYEFLLKKCTHKDSQETGLLFDRTVVIGRIYDKGGNIVPLLDQQ